MELPLGAIGVINSIINALLLFYTVGLPAQMTSSPSHALAAPGHNVGASKDGGMGCLMVE